MKRVFVVALVVAGCNGLVGIESASFTPIATATEAGAPEAGAPEAGTDSGPTPDAGPCTADLDTDPHHCVRVQSRLRRRRLRGRQMRASTPCSASLGASYESVATDSDNAHFVERTSASLKRAPINGGGPSTVMFAGDPTNGIAADIVVEDRFVYFIDDLTVTNESGIDRALSGHGLRPGRAPRPSSGRQAHGADGARDRHDRNDRRRDRRSRRADRQVLRSRRASARPSLGWSIRRTTSRRSESAGPPSPGRRRATSSTAGPRRSRF